MASRVFCTTRHERQKGHKRECVTKTKVLNKMNQNQSKYFESSAEALKQLSELFLIVVFVLNTKNVKEILFSPLLEINGAKCYSNVRKVNKVF